MLASEDPAADADAVQQASRALAHSTRSINDPRQIYSALGSLTSAVSSLSQTLQQIASFHDDHGRKTAWVPHDSPTGRAAAGQVSSDLHRSGEMLRQVAESIARAHEAEATIAYHRRDAPHLTEVPPPSVDRGLEL